MRINSLVNLNSLWSISENSKTTQNAISDGNLAEHERASSVKEPGKWNKNEKNQISKCPRWNLDKIPLKFFINRFVISEKFIPDFIDTVKLSFQPWARASYGLIRFQEIFDKNNADIIVNWSDTVVFGRDFEAGHTNLKVINNKIEKAEITIVIYPIIDRLAASTARIERVRRTALHEIGHSLGLNHSNSSKDMMFHRGIDNKSLSSNDIRRLNELYSSGVSNILT